MNMPCYVMRQYVVNARARPPVTLGRRKRILINLHTNAADARTPHQLLTILRARAYYGLSRGSGVRAMQLACADDSGLLLLN